MALTDITLVSEAKRDQKVERLSQYKKPNLIRLGTVTDLTAGAVGSVPDVTSPGTMPRAQR